MKYIKLYEFFMNNNELRNISKKNIPLLFHAIEENRAKKALTENKLGGYSNQKIWDGGKRLKDDDDRYNDSSYLRGISTTRDISYAANMNSIIFVFDKNKLKNKYKIVPYNWGYSIGRGYNQGARSKKEREEFIITGYNDNESINQKTGKPYKTEDKYNLRFIKMINKPNGFIEPLD